MINPAFVFAKGRLSGRPFGLCSGGQGCAIKYFNQNT